MQRSEDDLLGVRSFGKTSLREVKQELEKLQADVDSRIAIERLGDVLNQPVEPGDMEVVGESISRIKTSIAAGSSCSTPILQTTSRTSRARLLAP